MGQVADTSLRALEVERKNLRYPFWLQRVLFFRKAKGIHGVHSPLAFLLAMDVFMKSSEAPLESRLQEALPDFSFEKTTLSQVSTMLPILTEEGGSALWVTEINTDRAQWLAACADPRVSLAIDCFDCGLLLCTEAVKEKQYLRQKRVMGWD